MITRRTTQRLFLLKPCKAVDEVLLYCIAVAAQKYGVRIHSVTAMTNHYHMVLTDPWGRLPDFERWLNAMVARALNSHYGRWENFWSTEQPSHVQLVDAEDVLAKMVYTVTNPVAAGLVRRGEEWPGIRLFHPGKRKIARPKHFFDEQGDLPAEVVLEIVPAPLGVNAHESLRLVMEAVAAKEAEIRSKFRQEGRTFVGPQGIHAQSHQGAPTSIAPRRGLSPQLAGSTPTRMALIERMKRFVADYRAALTAWRNKVANVVFPDGTFFMLRRFDVTVAAPS